MFKDLLALDVNGKTDSVNVGGRQYKYLSWAWAWAEFVKIYPDATYKIIKNDIGLPYFVDKCGAMVYVEVTADGITHQMFLPVLNNANKPMRSEPYEYEVKGYSGKPPSMRKVEALNMFDINKSLMRCLVKCLAMFGLGLYIYAKEDLPEESEEARLDRIYPMLSECGEVDKKRMQGEYLHILKKHKVVELDFRKFLVDKKLQASNELHKWLRDESKLFELIKEFKGVK